MNEVTCFFHSTLHRTPIEALEQIERVMLKTQYDMGDVSFCYVYRAPHLAFADQQLALVVVPPSDNHDEFKPIIAIRKSSTSTFET